MTHHLMKLLHTFLTCAIIVSASLADSVHAESTVVIVDDRALHAEYRKHMAAFVKEGNYTPHSKLVEQLARTSCKLRLPAVGTKRMSPSEVYRLRIDATVMVGKSHRCNNPKCENPLATIASGVVIHEDGIVLTNYHVVANKVPKLLCMGVMTHDGKAYLVDEILAADKKSDIAILQLKDAKGLDFAPVYRDEPVGNSATIISHPTGKFFTLTQGLVSRYHKSSNGAAMMNVTADYAKGSSGGPVFNDRGDVIGLVANTVSIPYKHVPLHVNEKSEALEIATKSKKTHTMSGRPLTIGTNHQMTLKNTAPSRAILDLIEQ